MRPNAKKGTKKLNSKNETHRDTQTHTHREKQKENESKVSLRLLK